MFAEKAAAALNNAHLFELSVTDGLTKLYCQRYFMAILSMELVNAKRNNSSCSVLFIDFDNFKSCNDTYGHSFGDTVLKRAAEIFKQALRKDDFLARYGGEELVVILPNTAEHGAYVMGERLRKALERESFLVDGKTVKVTCSMGLAVYPKDSHDKNTLLENADKAMYHSKENGKNLVTIYSQI
jgi:diguanylate cyclase (GGDEF)-like protein